MKVVALLHFAVPHKMAGSETMLHTMLTKLVEAGHDVVCVVNELKDVTANYELDGVQYIPRRGLAALRAVHDHKPDLIITHHQNSMVGYKLAKQLKAKCALVVHNDHGPNIDFAKQDWDLLVFNTEWLREVYAAHGVDGIVIHPPVTMLDHMVSPPGSYITLVNLNEDKGSRIFYALAERFPRMKFLGVVGAHGKQIIRHDLPNVEIQENTPNMKRDVWRHTGILLMPSIYESYGMAGVEAMASGIPTIAAPTPGLKESQGSAGYFVKRDHIDGWASAIRQLTDPAGWRRQSVLARARGFEIEAQTEKEMRDWVATVEDVVNPKPKVAQLTVVKPSIPSVGSPEASIVVPWRETPDRAEGWRWLRSWYKHYHPTWELIEADVPGEWNKPAAVNEGVLRARAGVVLVMDADVLINPGTLRAAVREAQRAPWVVPHGKVHRLRPEPTSALLAAVPGEVTQVPHGPVLRTAYRGVAGGGAFAIRKASFLAMGGFDPKFTGWGGEDTSFGIAADTLLGAHVRYDHVPLVHLFHDPGLRSVHPSYGVNHARQELYERASGNREKMAELVGIEPFELEIAPVPRPSDLAPPEEWLSYLRYLGVHVPHHVTHQRVALVKMANQAEQRRG